MSDEKELIFERDKPKTGFSFSIIKNNIFKSSESEKTLLASLSSRDKNDEIAFPQSNCYYEYPICINCYYFPESERRIIEWTILYNSCCYIIKLYYYII